MAPPPTTTGQPMSLLAVHHGGGVGGAPVSLLKLLGALDPAAFRASAVFTQSGPILEYARDLGVPAEAVPTGGAFFYSAHARLGARTLARFVRTFPAAVGAARQTLRRSRPDMLHLNTSVLLAWAAAARRERVQVLWMVREVLGPNPILRGWHARYMLRHARQVVAISDAVRACFPPGAPIARVYNAVDLSEYRLDLLGERSAVRAELGLAESDSVVMAIGSVQRAKGHWLLLDVLAALLAHVPNAKLVLVAGGVDQSYRHSLRGRVKAALNVPYDNLDAWLRSLPLPRGEGRGEGSSSTCPVLVTGFRRDVPRLLAAADVVVFPSLLPEGFGRPIVEAMAMCRPVVATDLGPSREILDGAGLLVPPSAPALADALAGLLGDPDRRAALGAVGRARVESLFTLDRQVAEMSALYHRVSTAPVVT